MSDLLPWSMLAYAATPPGTVIQNRAVGTFEDPDDSQNTQIGVTSNEVIVTVAEVAGVTIANAGVIDDGEVNQGDTINYQFTITNTGNVETLFFIPDSPSSITNGSFNQGSAPIQIIEYDADGSGSGAAVDLTASNITVPAGGADTATLLGAIATANNGVIPAEATITLQVPITVDASGLSNGDSITVVMGDTADTGNGTQNQSDSADGANTSEVRTIDPTSGDSSDDPVNGEREASISQAVTVTVSGSSGLGQAQCLLPQNLVADGSFDNGLASFPSTGSWSTRSVQPTVINPSNEPSGTLANGYPALGNTIGYNENDSANDAITVTPTLDVDQTYLNGQLDIWFDTYWRHAGGGGSRASTLELQVNGTPYWQMTTVDGEGAGGSTLTTLNGATASANSPSTLNNSGGGGAFSEWGVIHLTIPYSSNTTPQIEFIMRGQGAASDDFGIDRIYVPVCLPDRGDAPDTYGTDATPNNNGSDPSGPIHRIVNDLHFGTSPDGELDDVTPLDGTGDGADEDGIVLATLTEGDTTYTIPATGIDVTNNSGSTATLHAWVDFDGSGTFEADEYASQTVANSITNGNPTGALTWSGAGVSGMTGNTIAYARFRLTTDGSLDANTPGGLVSDGEVEDYQIAIAPPVAMQLVKRITAIDGRSIAESTDNLTDIPTTATDESIADNHANWPTPLNGSSGISTYLNGSIDAGQVEPGQEIEYTIYFLSSSTKAITNVNICDMIPANTTYVPNSMSWQLGSAVSASALTDTSGDDVGEFYASGSSPIVPCLTDNSKGAVVFNIAQTSAPIPTSAPPTSLSASTGPGSPTDSYGYVRFRVTVD